MSTALRTQLDRTMTEKEWQSQVVTYARHRGWLWYHTHDSRRSSRGFPDLVLTRTLQAPGRVVFAELKTEKGVISPHQREWLTALELADAEVHVWRPRDWPEVARCLK